MENCHGVFLYNLAQHTVDHRERCVVSVGFRRLYRSEGEAPLAFHYAGGGAFWGLVDLWIQEPLVVVKQYVICSRRRGFSRSGS